MFTAAETLVDPGQGVERKWPFFPLLLSWYLIALVPVTVDLSIDFLAGRGSRGGERSPQGSRIQTEPGLASEPQQAVRNEIL